MQVKINGKAHYFEKKLTLAEILQELSIPQEQGVAIALNEDVVSKNHFSRTKIKDGDVIEIIHAVAGG